MTTTNDTRGVASQELFERCTQIRQLLAAGNANFHAIGVQYNLIVDTRLAEKAGFKNAPEFLTQQIKELSRSTLVTYGAVARAFSAEVCSQYGVSLLNQLIVYVEAAGVELDANDPSTMLISVPGADGELEEKFFGECTVVDLRKAIQRLRRPTSSAPLPAEVDARAQQCSAALTGYFPQQTGVRVEVRNRKGKAVMSLKDVPLEQMEQIAALLSTALRSSRAA
ncbi:hypothetical protein [Hyalangium gracile]|uniref:hypothetical protein n=1 Tax=Hyalangium gracile TaxID=394092 RepID=UPI001CCDC4C4|nr:hypothetical protein [Hyalangium gracile]